MRLYWTGNQKALILHAARLSQAMHNAATRARAKSPLPTKPDTPDPKLKYRHPDSDPIDALLGKTVYFSQSGKDGHVIAKNGNGSIALPLYGSGSVTVTKRTIGLGRGGDRSAVVLKDAQGNVIKVSVGIWTRIRWSWLMWLAEDQQEPDVLF
jgi:hypothetical protein